jgi:drug/metabolite transporter (DMT)-like permease
MANASPVPHHRGADRRVSYLPYLLLSLSSLFWAGNWIVGRVIRDTMPPTALNWWRWAIAALFLAPFALPRLKGRGALLRRHWPVLLVLGFSGIALFQFLIYTGLRYTNVINATLMNSAVPPIMMLVAWLIDRETVTLRQIIGVVVSFIGILVIMNRGDIATLANFSFNPGDLLILLAMPVWGVYSVVLRRRPAGLDGITFIFVVAVIGIVFLTPAYALESWIVQPVRLSWAAVGAVLYVACFASIGAYICWNRGVDMVGPNKAGFTAHLIPAFGTVLAVIFLGEEVHLFHVVGIATILLGVWLATSARIKVSAG